MHFQAEAAMLAYSILVDFACTGNIGLNSRLTNKVCVLISDVP